MICDMLGRKYGIEVKVLPMPQKADIPEDGDSYQANSLQKAQWIWDKYGKPCFADDSGLEVAALDGAPGIHTARYCDRDFASGMDKLLHELKERGAMEPEQRKASFECCIALIMDGKAEFFHGHCPGQISMEKTGDAGFGFDPVFIADATPSKCMAQLDDEMKNSISHRALALEKMFIFLSQMK